MTTLIVLVLGLAAPGAVATALLRIRSRPEERCSPVVLGWTAGVSIWLLAGGVVERLWGVSPASTWTLALVLGGGSLAVAAAVPSVRAFGASLRSEYGYGVVVVLVAAVSWAPVAWMNLRSHFGLFGSTPWYYFGLADQIARNHGVPAYSVEWGQQVTFLGDYRLFSVGTAQLFGVGGALASIRALIAISLISVVLGAVGISRSLGAGRFASLFAIPVTIATGFGAVRLTSYRPEALGIGLALLTVACFVAWLRARDAAALVVACLAMAATTGVHGIAAVTAAGLCAVAGLAYVPWDRVRWWPYAWRVVGGGGVALVVTTLVARVLTGVRTTAASSGGLSDRGGLGDPTWRFMTAIHGWRPSQPPNNRTIAVQALQGIYSGGVNGIPVAIFVGVCSLVVLIAALRAVEARRQVVFYAVSVAGLGVAAAYFALHWQGYVPRRTGSQRLMLEALILCGPIVACAVQWVSSWAARRIPSTRMAAVGATILAVVVALGFVASQEQVEQNQFQQPSLASHRVLASLHLPAGSRVLTNAYVEGYVDLVTRTDVLISGRAPYTFPHVLKRSLRLMRGAKAFFDHPREHLRYLETYGVDYVVLAEPHTFAAGTNNLVARHGSRAKLARTPVLREIAASTDLAVYKVDRAALRSAVG